jgi:uncharacterized protein
LPTPRASASSRGAAEQGQGRLKRADPFTYACHQCGRCCRDQVITLSPYDLLRIARAAGITTGAARRRYTSRRGSLLRFTDHGTCVALAGVHCTVHRGRPLACRLYPLGLLRDPLGGEIFLRLEPAPGSRGIYGEAGTVGAFLEAQGIGDYLSAIARYRRLLPIFRERIAALVDFEAVEPGEFWRCAVREALAETGFDPNPLIDALFDPDGLAPGDPDRTEGFLPSVDRHVSALATRIRLETAPPILAAAAIILGVSLGYAPAVAICQ